MPRMRDRILHPEFFTDAKLYDAERESGLPLRLAYAGLWCAADREGRFEWKPRELQLLILPYDDVDVAGVLQALVNYGFVAHYMADGQECGWIRRFGKWQHVHPREAKSALPAMPEVSGELPGDTGSSQELPGKARPRQAIPVVSTSISTSTSTSTSDSTSKEVPVAHATNGTGLPGGWPARWAQVYSQHVGEIGPSRIGKWCKPVRERYGPARSLEMWDAYCRQRRHFRFGEFDPKHNEIASTTPEDFAKTAKFWHEYTEPIHATPPA